MDLSLNDQFSVHLDDRNDLATVEGRAAFEQSVVVRVTDRMHDSITGITGRENIEEKIHLVVSRVAKEHDHIDSVASVDIQPKENAPDTYEVEVQYVEDDSLSFEVAP